MMNKITITKDGIKVEEMQEIEASQEVIENMKRRLAEKTESAKEENEIDREWSAL